MPVTWLALLQPLVADGCRFSHARPSAVRPEGFSSNFMAAHQQMRICCTSELEEVVVVSEVALHAEPRRAVSDPACAGGKAAAVRRTSHDTVYLHAARRSLASVPRCPHCCTASGLTPTLEPTPTSHLSRMDCVLVIKRLSSLRSHLARRRGSALAR